MIINVNSVSAYSPALSVAIKSKEEAAPAADAKDKDGESSSVAVNMSDVGQASAGGAAGTSQDLITQLQEQIKQVQKQLEQQQAQLAAAMNSKASDQEKAQRAMAIQQQIAGTTAQLISLQGALLQALKGSVNTTA